jgi:hypothetical protein
VLVLSSFISAIYIYSSFVLIKIRIFTFSFTVWKLI